jgi:hypothetical protein
MASPRSLRHLGTVLVLVGCGSSASLPAHAPDAGDAAPPVITEDAASIGVDAAVPLGRDGGGDAPGPADVGLPDVGADVAPLDAIAAEVAIADAADTRNDEVGVDGAVIDVSADRPTARSLQIAPAIHDFGNVVPGGTSDPFTFSISNFGTVPLSDFVVLVQGQFIAAAEGNVCLSRSQLDPGESCTIAVIFQPASRGSKQGKLVASGGGLTFTASLVGMGTLLPHLEITPTFASFSTIVGSPSAPVIFTVANPGDLPTGPLDVRLMGTDVAAFEIAKDDCLSPLAGGAGCQVSVRLRATTVVGSKSATLTASSPDIGQVGATLFGTVGQP